MRRKSNQQSLGEVMGGLVDTYGLREKMDELDITTAWDEVVGPMIAKHTVSIRLRRNAMRLKVDSAPLRHELSFQREGLAKLLNERLGRVVVTSISVE